MVSVRGLLVACIMVLLVPGSSALTIERHYEASGSYASGDPTSGGTFRSVAPCIDGRDTPLDAGACIRYRVPGVYDLVGEPFVVTVEDVLFSSRTWAVVTVDVDGDMSVQCGIGEDVCILGQGTIQGQIPADAVGGFLRVYPVTLYSEEAAGVPVGFASQGRVLIEFPEYTLTPT